MARRHHKVKLGTKARLNTMIGGAARESYKAGRGQMDDKRGRKMAGIEPRRNRGHRHRRIASGRM